MKQDPLSSKYQKSFLFRHSGSLYQALKLLGVLAILYLLKVPVEEEVAEELLLLEEEVAGVVASILTEELL